MRVEQHLLRTNGKGKEVHEFIDQFYEIYGDKHRAIFHHKEGIEWVVKIFGEEARWIAEKHVFDDINGDMFNDPIPESKNDYRMENESKLC